MDHTDLCPACVRTVSYSLRDSELHCSACGLTKDAARAYVNAKSVASRLAEGRGARRGGNKEQMVSGVRGPDGSSRFLAFLGYGILSYGFMTIVAPLVLGSFASETGTPSWRLITEGWVLVWVGVFPLAFGIRALHRWLRTEGASVAGRLVAGILCAGVALVSGFFASMVWSLAPHWLYAKLLATIYVVDAIGMVYFVWLATGGVAKSIRGDSPPRQIGPGSIPIQSDHGREVASAQDLPAEGDPILLLEKLKKLLDIGAITPEEYDRKKREVLGRI